MAAPYHALRHTGSAAFGRAEGMLPAGDFRDLAKKAGNMAGLPADRHNWQANARPDQMTLCRGGADA